MIRDLIIAIIACSAIVIGFGDATNGADLVRDLLTIIAVLIAIAVIAVAGSVVRRSPHKGGFR